MRQTRTYVSILVLTGVFVLFPNFTYSATSIFGHIISDTTWHSGEVYIVEGNMEVKSGVTLTIEPGTIIKFNYGASVTVLGTLSANGIAGDEVNFTSISDDSVGGDTNGDGLATIPIPGSWAKITVSGDGTLNLNHSFIRYGGTWSQYTNIFQDGGTLNVTNSISEFSGYGFRINSGVTRIENNIIRNNQYGIEATGPGSLALNNNTFINNTTYPAYISFDGGKALTSSGNTALGNGQNGIAVSGAMSVDQVWTDQIPYIVYNLSIPPGRSLTINAGTKVKLINGGAMVISGDMNVNGASNNKIYFTSIKDDSIGGDTNGDGFSSGTIGDWGLIFLPTGAVANFNHSVIRYGSGGWPNYSNIAILGGSLNMANSEISSGNNGLRIYDGWANIVGSAITGNVIGILIEGGGVSISNSSITGNTGYGIYNGTFVEMNAENNWWGDVTGPYNFWNNDNGQGDKISTLIDFEPWLTSPPLFSPDPVSSKEPVIIVPGMLGSRLNRVSDGEEVWPNIEKMTSIVDFSDSYLDELKFGENGNEIIDMNPSKVIEDVLFLSQYGNLIDKFKDKGYELGVDLFLFPYDWRLDAEVSSLGLDSVINQAITQSPTGKVNIIAHSMGGLVVKDYLINNGDSAINKLIFAGTPHLGAPKAFNALNYGDDFDLRFLIFGLNKNKAKEIAQNMPGVYELLPSREYLNKSGPYVNGLNYEQTNELMVSGPLLVDHRNSGLLSVADGFHQTHDSWLPQSADVYNLIGCRAYDTIGSFEIDDDGSVDVNSITGDGTVPFVSANHMSAGDKYFVNYPVTKINHMGLVKDERMINLIHSLITSSNEPNLPAGVSKTLTGCDASVFSVKRLRFSTHSPVNLHVYDSSGNHTGLTPDGNIEMNIPDSEFLQVGDNSFVFVPDRAELGGGAYSVKIDAYATGSFDFKVKELSNGEVQGSASYEDILIFNSGLRADYSFTDIDNPDTLNIDENGDGEADVGYTPDGIRMLYNGIENIIWDVNMAYELEWISTIKERDSYLRKLERALRMEKRIDKLLATSFLNDLEKSYNKGQISERAYSLIKEDILWLLGNQ